AQLAAARDEIGRVLPALLPLRHFLRRGVAGGLALLDGLDDRAALALQLLGAIEHRRESVERTAAAKRVAEQIHLLAQHANVVHALFLWSPGRERAEAAVRIHESVQVHESLREAQAVDGKLRADVLTEEGIQGTGLIDDVDEHRLADGDGEARVVDEPARR